MNKMGFKPNLIFLFFILGVLLVTTAASAIETEMIYPYNEDSSASHYYQVVFDGEGEASVLAKLTALNTGTQDVSEITFEIPGKHVNLKYVFQEVKKKDCSSYCAEYQDVCASYEKVCTDWDATAQSCNKWTDRCSSYERKCVRQEERCYWSGRSVVPLEYNSEQLSKSTKFTVKLNQNILAGDAGTLLIYYKVTGYVDKLINYKFDFETIKSPTDISYLRVAIGTDSDLYLRGGETKVDYRSNFLQVETVGASAKLGEAITGDYASAIGEYSRNVRYARGYVKEKSNLDPWESFHVYGEYNASGLWFLTYFWEIVALFIILMACKFVLWKRIKNAFKPSEPIELKPRETKGGRFTRIAIAGFLSAVLVLVVWWAIFAGMSALMNALSWEFQRTFGLLLVLVAGITIVLAFALPSIYMGKKYGLMDGALTFASTMAWLFAIILVMTALFGSTAQPIYYATEVMAEATKQTATAG